MREEGRKERTMGAEGNLGRSLAEGERSQCWPLISVMFLASSSSSDSESEEDELGDETVCETPCVGSS